MRFFIFFCLTTCILLYACTEVAHPVSSEPNEANWALDGFVKLDDSNPILAPNTESTFECPVRRGQVAWESKNVLNPSAVVKDDKVYLIYRAQDSSMVSRLGMAISDDGIHFERQALPIFYPDNDLMNAYEWPGGVEDPRIIEDESGRYILTYTAYDGKVARLCLATSDDLYNWTKHGPVLNDEKYKSLWSKSGAIVVQQQNDRMVATKINGLYWMYFGDTDLFMATSEDLIHWEAVEDQESDRLIRVLNPRKGYFDSRLVEPGPYALLRDEGILLIYNASNSANYNDPALPKYTYAAGQALFDRNAPYRLIERSKSYFIHPDKEYERVGEVNEVCFVEGLVHFKDRWYLYYGTADSKIAVAVKG